MHKGEYLYYQELVAVGCVWVVAEKGSVFRNE